MTTGHTLGDKEVCDWQEGLRPPTLTAMGNLVTSAENNKLCLKIIMHFRTSNHLRQCGRNTREPQRYPPLKKGQLTTEMKCALQGLLHPIRQEIFLPNGPN